MKFNSSQSARQRRFKTLAFIAGLMLAPLLAPGTQTIFYCTTNVLGTPPQVDATSFFNSGTWFIGTTTPYQTYNTLNFTNKGAMYGFVGWEFDYGPVPGNGGRAMAASFYNANGALIEGLDGTTYNTLSYTPVVSSFIISATNLVNKGTLIGGPAGNLVLNGANVNLSRSALGIGSVSSDQSCSANSYLATNFTPSLSIFDRDWVTNGVTLNSAGFWDGTTVSTPFFTVDGPCGASNVVAPVDPISFTPVLADSITNVGAYTNIVTTNQDGITTVTNHEPSQIFKQAVFVSLGDANIFPADTFFANSGNPSNLFETITVQLTSQYGDQLYLEDMFASLTNHEFLENSDTIPGNYTGTPGSNPFNGCDGPTFRPGCYVLSRGGLACPATLDFNSGLPGNGPPGTNFFYDPSTYSNAVVQAYYASYGGYITNIAPTLVGNALSNSPGRIVINATNLNLTYASITNRGSEVVIHAKNFEGSSGAVIQCQNLSYNLGSTNGSLNIAHLSANTYVPGLHGNLYAWSGVWTNGVITGVFTNYYFVTNSAATNTSGGGSSTLTNNVITNIAQVDFHALLVDARDLSDILPVNVQDLILQSNAVNMVFSDDMRVLHSLFFGGQSLTISQGAVLALGGLTSYGDLNDWDSSIAPSLLYFTNNGTLFIPGRAQFGTDTATNYAAFVNHGTISVGESESIDSVFYQSSGSEVAPNGYYVTTVTGKVENAVINSGVDMDFTADSLKLDHAILSANGAFNFALPNAPNTSLYDSGGSANNSLTCGDGFNLWAKPATGDLLGTTIASAAFNGAEVDSVWAAQDRGSATTAGYTNNVALGTLYLAPVGGSGYPALFYFSGPDPTGAYAMYVDLLDLSQITNLTEMLQTDPNLVIYYAAAKLPSTITVLNSSGVPVQEVATNNPANGQTYYLVANGGSGQIWQEAEEVLNGQLDGHLRWVTNFAGPNSSVDVLINGQTYAVNRALRYSLAIDSNGNGTPNGVDPYPFPAPPQGSAPQLMLSASLASPTGQTSSNTAQTVQSFPSTPPTVALSWLADPNAVYQVQYRTNLVSGVWRPLLNYTNTAATNVHVTVWDTNAAAGQRFYRLSRP